MAKLSEQTLTLMKELTEACGVSGHEKYVTRILKHYYEKYCDEIVYDNLGSIYGIKRSKALDAFKVMLEGHCDEVGLIVIGINSNGTLNLATVGGVLEDTVAFKQVSLINYEGEIFKGCICTQRNPKATGDGVPTLKEMVLDIGFTSEEEVRDHGIMEGDMVAFDTEFTVLGDGDRLMAKAWDNRYGCLIGVEILEALKDAELPFDLIVGVSVQEEVGFKGAMTSVDLINPDMAIVFDCTGTPDIKGYSSPDGGLGHGVMIRFMDRTYLVNRTMLMDYLDIVKKNGLPYQWLKAGGSTIASTVNTYGVGIPVLTACICARNVHSNALIIDVDDYLNTKKAVLAYLSELNRDKLEKYKANNR